MRSPPWDFQLSEKLTRGIREIHYDRPSVHDGTKAHIVIGSPSTAARKPMPRTAITEKVGSVDETDILIFRGIEANYQPLRNYQ